MKSVFIFDNFNVAAFSPDGEQIPSVQRNLLCMWAEHCSKEGFDMNGAVVETSRGNWKLFKTEDGYNVEKTGYKIT